MIIIQTLVVLGVLLLVGGVAMTRRAKDPGTADVGVFLVALPGAATLLAALLLYVLDKVLS